MKGDRYGDVVRISRKRKPGVFDKRDWLPAYSPFIEIARVKLDKSGKTIKVDLDDCEVVG